jgi:ABC-2 type transport system ATP-binding protein
VLVVTEVTKSFRHALWPFGSSVPVLRGARLEIARGELVGLVGENGSGKSTLMKIIAGMLASDSGTVEFRGTLGYCPQLPQLWEKLTVSEHLELFINAYGFRYEPPSETEQVFDTPQDGTTSGSDRDHFRSPESRRMLRIGVGSPTRA